MQDIIMWDIIMWDKIPSKRDGEFVAFNYGKDRLVGKIIGMQNTMYGSGVLHTKTSIMYIIETSDKIKLHVSDESFLPLTDFEKIKLL